MLPKLSNYCMLVTFSGYSHVKSGLATLGRFSAFCIHGKSFVFFCLISCQPNLLKGSTLKGKNLLPNGASSFLLNWPIIIIMIGFLINMQVQGQHPHHWAPFQVSHQISRCVYHEGPIS